MSHATQSIRACCATLGKQGRVALAGIIGIVLGLLIELAKPDDDVLTWLRLPGNLWVRVLRCGVAPLVASSMITSVAGLALLDKSRSGATGASGAVVGTRLVCWYVGTSFWCALWGLLFYNLFSGVIRSEQLAGDAQPMAISLKCSESAGGGWVVEANGWSGVTAGAIPSLLCNASEAATAAVFPVNGTGAVTSSQLARARTFTGAALALFEGLFPDNFVAAIATDNLLGVITASVALGIAASVVSRRRKRGVFADDDEADSAASIRRHPSTDDVIQGHANPVAATSVGGAAGGGDAGTPASKSTFASRIAGASATSYTSVEKQQEAEQKETGSESLGSRTGSVIIWFAEEIQASVIVIVEVVILAAPVAVASLLAATFAAVSDPGRVFAEAGLLIGVHALAIGLHVALVLPAFHSIATGACCAGSGRRGGLCGAYTFMTRYCADAYLTAFATSSSAATLPVTMRCVTAGGVPADLARFTTSLGATLNLDGTAIGYPIVALWMAQTSGIPITAGTQVIVAVMSTLASVGAAPIPQAGTVLLISIWAAAFPGIPLPPAFGIFLSVDALMDRWASATADAVARNDATLWPCRRSHCARLQVALCLQGN